MGGPVHRRLAALAAIAAFAVSCGELLGVAPPSDPDASVVVVTEDGGRCVCLPPVPADWKGPFVVDELSDCAGAWSVEVARGYAAPDAGAHECSCTCTAPASTCTYRPSNEPGCTNPACVPASGAVHVTPGQCFSKGIQCNSHYRFGVDGGGPCRPDAGQKMDPPGWGMTARRCAPTQPPREDVCPNAVPCVPEHPSTAAHCIVHDGTSPCPPSFGARRVHYADLADKRGCTPCTCADAGAACELGLYEDPGQQCATPVGTTHPGLCTPFQTVTSFKLLRERAACAPTGGQPTGTITPTDPVTVCCRAD